MLAAVTAVKGANPKAVVVAVPVGAPQTCQALRSHVDDVVCATTPEPFRAVGLWYRDFAQVDDAEVHALLESRVRDDFPRS
jgi:predicted phosphoribosyltransferase